jgi:hypothetical protein
MNLSRVHGHTLEKVQTMFGEDAGDIPEALLQITQAYEKSPPGEPREMVHATQHEMLLNHQEFVNKQKCVKLLTRLNSLPRKIETLQKAGKFEEAEKLQQLADQASAMISVYCPTDRSR